MYTNPLPYKNGELVRKEEKTKTKQAPPPSISEFFDTLQKVPPSRQENPIQLLYDLISGEDITKPKTKKWSMTYMIRRNKLQAERKWLYERNQWLVRWRLRYIRNL